MARVFVSRSLTDESPLRKWLVEKGHSLTAFSLLRFRSLPFALPPPVDWTFFYSPRAANFYLDGLSGQRPGGRFAAIGPGTARTLRASGWPCHFTGRGEPEEVARQFLGLSRGQTVLFPRAEQSRRSIERYLGDEVVAIDRVVYSNEIDESKLPPEAEIVILTSPLNVQAYCQRYPSLLNTRYYAIGPSTAMALAQRGVSAPFPTTPGEVELVDLLSAEHTTE